MEGFEFDLSKLRGRIREVLGSETKYQQLMGFSNHKRDQRLNGKSFFKQDEIIKTCEILDIKTDEIKAYFFEKIVRKTEL